MPGLIERVLLLGRVDAFARVDTELLSFLALGARVQTVGSGAWVYREREVGHAMYVIVDGRVVIEQGGVCIATLSAGEDFGTWALFDPEPSLTGARAAVETQLLGIERIVFERLVEEHPELARGIFRSLARRVRSLAEAGAHE